MEVEYLNKISCVEKEPARRNILQTPQLAIWDTGIDCFPKQLHSFFFEACAICDWLARFETRLHSPRPDCPLSESLLLQTARGFLRDLQRDIGN